MPSDAHNDPAKFANMRDPAVQKLVAARVTLLFENRLLGEIATALILTMDDDVSLLSVIGRQLLYNRTSVLATSGDALATALKAIIPPHSQRPTSNELTEGLTHGSMEGSAELIATVLRRTKDNAARGSKSPV